MVGKVPHVDDSESDWDSITQPFPFGKQADESTTLTVFPTIAKTENSGANYSSDHENDVTDIAATQEPHPSQYSLTNRDKSVLAKKNSTISSESQDLPSLAYNSVSTVRETDKNLHDVLVYGSEDRKNKPWNILHQSSLRSGNGTEERSLRQTDIADIAIQSQNLTEKKKSYHADLKLPSTFDSTPEEKGQALRNIASKHNGANMMILSGAETEVPLVDETAEIFPYERCNVEFHESSEKRTKSFADAWNAKVLNASNRIWAGITVLLEMPFLFLLALILHLIRFTTSGLLRPLIVGLLRGISDGLLKPVLSVLHNALLVPFAVFGHNIGLALHTALVPIGSIIAIVTEALGHLMQSCRLVEVHVHTGNLGKSCALHDPRNGMKTIDV